MYTKENCLEKEYIIYKKGLGIKRTFFFHLVIMKLIHLHNFLFVFLSGTKPNHIKVMIFFFKAIAYYISYYQQKTITRSYRRKQILDSVACMYNVYISLIVLVLYICNVITLVMAILYLLFYAMLKKISKYSPNA